MLLARGCTRHVSHSQEVPHGLPRCGVTRAWPGAFLISELSRGSALASVGVRGFRTPGRLWLHPPPLESCLWLQSPRWWPREGNREKPPTRPQRGAAGAGRSRQGQESQDGRSPSVWEAGETPRGGPGAGPEAREKVRRERPQGAAEARGRQREPEKKPTRPLRPGSSRCQTTAGSQKVRDVSLPPSLLPPGPAPAPSVSHSLCRATRPAGSPARPPPGRPQRGHLRDVPP